MRADNRTDDYWLLNAAAPELQTNPDMRIDLIDGIEPLDGQFGAERPKTVPDALFDLLFGSASQDQSRSLGGDVGKPVELQTYAILDAAKMPRLQELLEGSRLEYRCLFKGSAYDELQAVAPWLVRLEEDNAFTRNLFTAGPQPWVFWNEAPGIFIRSAAAFSDVWGHFRKFTKAKNDRGKWFYLRFWEPVVVRDFPDCLMPSSFAKFLGPHRVTSCLPDGTALTFAVAPPEDRKLSKPDPHDPLL